MELLDRLRLLLVDELQLNSIEKSGPGVDRRITKGQERVWVTRGGDVEGCIYANIYSYKRGNPRQRCTGGCAVLLAPTMHVLTLPVLFAAARGDGCLLLLKPARNMVDYNPTATCGTTGRQGGFLVLLASPARHKSSPQARRPSSTSITGTVNHSQHPWPKHLRKSTGFPRG